MTVAFQKAIPILRIFSVVQAKEFYVDYLGFTVDWKCRRRVVTVAHSLCPRGRRQVRP